MNTYCLKKSYRYVVYGAAFMGKFVLAGLRKTGYEVSAFLDKRAERIQDVEGLSVYHPKDFVDAEKENTVVIVAITNPFEHPIVAKLLADIGYKKIIYKMSANNGYQSEYAQNLFDVYEKIVEGSIDESTVAFEYDDNFKNVYFEESGIIKKTEDEVVVYLPVELCYGHIAANHPLSEVEQQNNPDVKASINQPILFAEKWIIDLFRGFEGYEKVGSAIQEFKKYLYRNPWRYYSFPRTKQGIDDLLTNRYTVFVQMNQLLNKGMEFFENTPIEVEWNSKGYFNLLDGTHRVCFFVAKGLTKVPARMRRDDYESWKNESKLKQCVEFLQKNECLPAYTPIPHPHFYNYPTYRDMAGIPRRQYLFEYLKKRNIDMRQAKVLEIGSYFSYFAQIFYKMGADVTTVELLENSFELGRLFNELLYCDGIKTLLGDIEEIDLPETYDITVMLTVVYPYIGTEKGRNILRKIDKATGKLLLWESGDEPQKEIEFIMKESSFDGYEKIAETYGTGKIRELGAFYKE